VYGRVISVLARTALGLVLALAPPLTEVVRAQSVGVSGLVDLEYQRSIGGDEAGIANAVTLGFRARSLTGHRLASCLGLDARAGVGGGGATYLVEGYPIGIGLRYGGTSQVALCAGVGFAGVSGGAVPVAWTLPVELYWEATGAYAIVRPLVVARMVQVPGSDERNAGSGLLSSADEFHAAAGVRIMVPAEPLAGFLTADGVFIGLTYDEALGARVVGVAIGYGFAAGE